jgi:hypothetical protein
MGVAASMAPRGSAGFRLIDELALAATESLRANRWPRNEQNHLRIRIRGLRAAWRVIVRAVDADGQLARIEAALSAISGVLDARMFRVWRRAGLATYQREVSNFLNVLAQLVLRQVFAVAEDAAQSLQIRRAASASVGLLFLGTSGEVRHRPGFERRRLRDQVRGAWLDSTTRQLLGLIGQALLRLDSGSALRPLVHRAERIIDANLRKTRARAASQDPIGNAPSTTSPSSGRPTETPELSLEALACGLLMMHPDWSNTRIAKELGCARTSLNRWKLFTGARRVMKAEQSAQIPRGRKDPETGAVEAEVPGED